MKIGVLGLGSIGLRHAKNLFALGHEVHGWDINSENAKPLVAMGGYWWTNAGAFWDAIEAVVIATPTREHISDLNIALMKGKHIFIEKPIGHHLSVAHLVERAKDRPRVLMVGNNLRFHSCVRKAKEWLPKIGHPLWASFTLAQYNDKPAYLRDGVILNWGAHEIDLVLYLLGEITVRASVVGRGGEETIADITLLHANGCQTVVHLDYLSKAQQRCFLITGTNGVIMCDLLRRSTVFLTEDDISRAKSLYQDPDGTWDDDYINEMKAFVDACKGKPKTLLDVIPASGEDGLRTLEICLKAREMAV